VELGAENLRQIRGLTGFVMLLHLPGGPGMLDKIAAELNSRPRKRHGFRAPAEVLDEIPTIDADNHGAA
jgi:hypothetical protein